MSYAKTTEPRAFGAVTKAAVTLPTIVQPGQTKTMGTIEGAAIGAFVGGLLGLGVGLAMKNTGLGSTVGTLVGATVGGAVGYSQASGSAATATAANTAAASGIAPAQGSMLPVVATPIYPGPITQPNPVVSVSPGSPGIASPSSVSVQHGNSVILQLPSGTSGVDVSSSNQNVIGGGHFSVDNTAASPTITVPTLAAGTTTLSVSASPWSGTATLSVTAS